MKGRILGGRDRLLCKKDNLPAKREFQLAVYINLEAIDIRVSMRENNIIWRKREKFYLEVIGAMNECYIKLSNI